MTTCLYNFILTAGAEKVAQSDPSGWTLTLVSVSVVFLALVVLCIVYSLSDAVFTGKLEKSKSPTNEETAAAIALALALHLNQSDRIHDKESGVITMTEDNSLWGNKCLTFRRMPKKLF